MSPATDAELKAAREQGTLRKELQKTAAVARFEDVEEFLQEHLKIGMVFQKEPGGDTIVIAGINWEPPIRQAVVGNPDTPLFPPDFPSIPGDPKKRGALWDNKNKRPRLEGFKSVYVLKSQHYDETSNVHHLVWYRDTDEAVQYQIRKRGFKSPNAKTEKLPLPKFLSLLKGWQVVDQE